MLAVCKILANLYYMMEEEMKETRYNFPYKIIIIIIIIIIIK